MTTCIRNSVLGVLTQGDIELCGRLNYTLETVCQKTAVSYVCAIKAN